jgi:hypothetical protein
VADASIAAALGSVVVGARPNDLEERLREAARSAGALRCDAAVRTSGRGALRAGDLVQLAVWGRVSGSWFASARTAVVGYDTLDGQVALCTAALAALQAISAVLDRAAGLGPAAGTFYFEVDVVDPPWAARLGDMYRVLPGPDGSGSTERLTRLAQRLWL